MCVFLHGFSKQFASDKVDWYHGNTVYYVFAHLTKLSTNFMRYFMKKRTNALSQTTLFFNHTIPNFTRASSLSISIDHGGSNTKLGNTFFTHANSCIFSITCCSISE